MPPHYDIISNISDDRKTRSDVRKMRLYELISQKFGDMSIVKKFRFSVVVIIIIPMILIFTIIFSRSYTELKSRTIEMSKLSMEQAERSIKNIVEETEYLSLSMLTDANIQKLCKQYALGGSTMDSVKRQLYVSIQGAMESKSYIDSISISYNTDVLFQYGNKVKKEDRQLNEKAMEMGGKGFWTQTCQLEYQEDYPGSNYVVSYVRAFMDVSKFNEAIGLQRISISEDALSQTFASLLVYDMSEACVIQKEGYIVSAINKEIINQNILDIYPGVNQVLKETEGYFGTKVNRTNVIVIFQDIEGTDWKLVQVVPIKVLLSSSYSLFLLMFFAFLLLVLFSIIFSRIENRTIIRPIYELSNKMAQVKENHFDIQIHSTSQDEIGQLTKSFEKMLEATKDLIERVYVSQIREKESYFQALESQINPHFLYNVLDSIHWTAVKQKDWDVSDRIEALSELFRQVLNKGDSVTTIGAEVKHLQNYLFLQKNKFAGKILVSIDVDKNLMNCRALKLILQPLVENAIHHGLSSKEGIGNISVWTEHKEEAIYIYVEDDGIGVDEELIRSLIYSKNETGEAFALKNIHDRIQLQYGEEYGLRFESARNVGTIVTLKIPYLPERGVDRETDGCR